MNKESQPYIVAITIFLCLFILIMMCLMMLNSCTVSMTMNHSEGGTTALDEDQATTANPSTSVPVSLTSIPGAK